ncbi:MAG: phenylalanine--tRNA ligase subunit beta [Nanoarchaeota archaeon]|nr:phenylalanine--tRNA ligase subunit beta [Nanoarchaeota archaeon]
MPTIKLNKKVFEELVGKKLPLDQLKDRISMLGTDLESIEGNEINVEVFPNRPDMLSEQGFARAFASFIGEKTGLRKYDVQPSGAKVIIDKSVAGVRPFTACAIVRELNFTDEKIKEIIQIQEKLHITFGRNRKKAAIGVYPLEHIKTPITFFAEDPKKVKFQPLEFPKEITALQVLSQHPAGKEYGHLLEGMNKISFFKDATGSILSMPPIINSNTTGKISEGTREVFVECSGFDMDTLEKCLNMIVTALADMGGKVYSMELEYPDKKLVTPNLEPEEMELDIDYINKRLGLQLSEKEIVKCLEKMGYGFNKGKALVPAYRADVLHQVDLAEDVAIAYGYENFEHEIPHLSTIGKESGFAVFKNKINNILAGLGLIEVNTYHITSKNNQTSMMGLDIPLVELENALNIEYSSMRAWIIPSIMEVLRSNKHNEYPQNLFNIGIVFKKDKSKETNVKEDTRLAVALCGEDSDFTKIKQVFDYLLKQIDCSYETAETDHPSFIPGRVARIAVNSKNIAYIGEISPAILDNFDLQMPVAAFELNLSELYEINNK